MTDTKSNSQPTWLKTWGYPEAPSPDGVPERPSTNANTPLEHVKFYGKSKTANLPAKIQLAPRAASVVGL
jgi:hypothetical protein